MFQALRLINCDDILNQFIQIPVQNLFQPVGRQLDPVIRDSRLRKIVGTYLFASIPCPHLTLSVRAHRFLLFSQFNLIQPRAQNL